VGVVDAIDATAERFYRRHGGVAVPDHARRRCRRIKDIGLNQGHQGSLETASP
jgi:hypothetical protein